MPYSVFRVGRMITGIIYHIHVGLAAWPTRRGSPSRHWQVSSAQKYGSRLRTLPVNRDDDCIFMRLKMPPAQGCGLGDAYSGVLEQLQQGDVTLAFCRSV